MALTVGELNALITIDDRAVDPGLRRTEQAMRATGQRLGSDAQQAGTNAGQQLGGNFVRGADGQWRQLGGGMVDAVTQARLEAEREAHIAGARIAAGLTDDLDDGLTAGARRAGADAGDALGDGLGDTAQGEGEETAGRLEQGLGKLKLAAAGIGAAAGALLIDSLSQAMEQGQITGRLAAQLGATPAEAQKYGHIAGNLYASAVTEDFQGAADAISAVMRAGIAPPDATEAQLQSIATKVSDLATTFDLDLGQTANAVGQMIKTGLAKDGVQAVDALTAGLQRMGPRADDIADTFNEYSTQFRQMGLDATTATGLLSQGMKAGARDTDVVADALKEFVLIAQGGKVDAAFKAIGLNGKEMQRTFVEGGPPARKALDQVFDGLRKIKDPAKRNSVALQLFATKSEDTQKALLALDPSSAADALGTVGGSADKMGDRLRDNAGTRLEAFKRGMQQNLVEFLGTKVIPKLTDLFGFVQDHKGAFTALAIGVGVLGTAFSIAAIGVWAFNSAMLANPVFWIVAGIIVAVAGLVLLVITYWDQIKAATLTVWDWITGKISGAVDLVLLVVGYLSKIPGMVSSFFSSMVRKVADIVVTWLGWVRGIPGKVAGALASMAGFLKSKAVEAFNAFRSSASAKVTSLISWARGIPGRVSGAIGAVKNLLYSKGRDIVLGLWNGIVGMGGWLRSKLIGWAKAIIPGPVAKALGIGSPSKVMAKQVGHWIPAGIAKGAEDNAGVIEDTMQSLVDVPTPSASMALGVSSAMNGGSAMHTAMAPKVVRIGSDGSAFGDLLIDTLRKKMAALGGDVQFVLGK